MEQRLVGAGPCSLVFCWPPTPLLPTCPGVDASDYAADREAHLLPVAAVVHWMDVPLHGQITRNTCNGLKLPDVRGRVRGTLARSPVELWEYWLGKQPIERGMHAPFVPGDGRGVWAESQAVPGARGRRWRHHHLVRVY